MSLLLARLVQRPVNALVVPCVEAHGLDEPGYFGGIVGKVVSADLVGKEGLCDADFGAISSRAFVSDYWVPVAVGVGQIVPDAAVGGLDDQLLAHATDGAQGDTLKAVGRRVQSLMMIQVVGRVAMVGELLMAPLVDSLTVVQDIDELKTGVRDVDADAGSTGVNGVFNELSGNGDDIVDGLVVQDKVTELHVELRDNGGGHDGQRGIESVVGFVEMIEYEEQLCSDEKRKMTEQRGYKEEDNTTNTRHDGQHPYSKPELMHVSSRQAATRD